MITKNDLLLILSEMSGDGINTTEMVQKVIQSSSVPLDVLKFINSNRELDLNKFYTHLRKSYNQKKSKLYINIMKDITDVNEVLTTLSALNLQILLFSKKADDRQLFLKHSRAQDIAKVLYAYYENFNLSNCLKLLRLIKADIIAFETINGKRDEISA